MVVAEQPIVGIDVGSRSLGDADMGAVDVDDLDLLGTNCILPLSQRNWLIDRLVVLVKPHEDDTAGQLVE